MCSNCCHGKLSCKRGVAVDGVEKSDKNPGFATAGGAAAAPSELDRRIAIKKARITELVQYIIDKLPSEESKSQKAQVTAILGLVKEIDLLTNELVILEAKTKDVDYARGLVCPDGFQPRDLNGFKIKTLLAYQSIMYEHFDCAREYSGDFHPFFIDFAELLLSIANLGVADSDDGLFSKTMNAECNKIAERYNRIARTRRRFRHYTGKVMVIIATKLYGPDVHVQIKKMFDPYTNAVSGIKASLEKIINFQGGTNFLAVMVDCFNIYACVKQVASFYDRDIDELFLQSLLQQSAFALFGQPRTVDHMEALVNLLAVIEKMNIPESAVPEAMILVLKRVALRLLKEIECSNRDRDRDREDYFLVLARDLISALGVVLFRSGLYMLVKDAYDVALNIIAAFLNLNKFDLEFSFQASTEALMSTTLSAELLKQIRWHARQLETAPVQLSLAWRVTPPPFSKVNVKKPRPFAKIKKLACKANPLVGKANALVDEANALVDEANALVCKANTQIENWNKFLLLLEHNKRAALPIEIDYFCRRLAETVEQLSKAAIGFQEHAALAELQQQIEKYKLYYSQSQPFAAPECLLGDDGYLSQYMLWNDGHKAEAVLGRHDELCNELLLVKKLLACKSADKEKLMLQLRPKKQDDVTAIIEQALEVLKLFYGNLPDQMHATVLKLWRMALL